jgi:nucleoside-diphosphate-sugar epimerase
LRAGRDPNMRRALITGATGFVGRVLCRRLAAAGYRLRAAVRSDCELPSCIAEKIVVGDISVATEWRAALADVDLVVHAAARTHVPRGDPQNSALYEAVNVHGTRQLAQAAAGAGVRRFVYLSSIKVNGESTGQRPYEANDPPAPRDDYGKSKLQAETYLLKAAAGTAMEPAIVRPPLVYGPGVRANFLRLMRAVDNQWPLPFGAVRNRRSLVSVWNLCDLIETLLVTERSAAGVWLVSDGEDPSTPELIRRLARAMQRSVRLVAVPVPLLQLCAAIAGRGMEAARLCGSLTVSIAATRATLGWAPPVSMDEALMRTSSWYRAQFR